VAGRIEDYALIGNSETAALVCRDGSIDWFCAPRFDSPACFAALLGTDGNGRFVIAPSGGLRKVTRQYEEDTLVLRTEFSTDSGAAAVVDFMPFDQGAPTIVRLVEGLTGEVPMRMELVIRFDYGSVLPWVTRQGGRLVAVAGPDALSLWTPVATYGRDFRTYADFSVREGQRVPFVLMYHPSNTAAPPPPDAVFLLERTRADWRAWLSHCSYEGDDAAFVRRSLAVLRAMTYKPTGGIVAAPTTSLPEAIGGERNWDYRYCWLRDATLTVQALLRAGFHDEALDFRDWLVRVVAGDITKLQVLYDCLGTRRLTEYEIPWLSGYEGSRPVRVGNAASEQFQLDVYGEVMSTLDLLRCCGLQEEPHAWEVQREVLRFLEGHWDEPDDGIWEVRGGRKHFVYSKVMAWVAFDRAAKAVGAAAASGATSSENPLVQDADRARDWARTAERIREEVMRRGYHEGKGAFVQHYDTDELDGSVLLLPAVGFIEAGDPRFLSTLRAVERELVEEGFVLRYRTKEEGNVDGLRGREGAFLPCSFWLVDAYTLTGQLEKADELFRRLLGVGNDLMLFSEEYDPRSGRLVGNFPQAFTHIALVNSAFLLAEAKSQPERPPAYFEPPQSLRLRERGPFYALGHLIGRAGRRIHHLGSGRK
jgi:GH15 family glucan-1,4-alpha-glucosidase